MIQISQVYANDSNSLKFIERIYTESFPPDERRDFSDVIRLLEENDDFFDFLQSRNVSNHALHSIDQGAMV